MIPADWPFDQAPNVAAITTVNVLERGAAILVVLHYDDDDSWAFVCGTTNDEGDGRVIGMRTALHLDPTLREIADASRRVLEKCGFTRDTAWSGKVEFPNLAAGLYQDALRSALVLERSATQAG